jgi:hypothetical protein
MSEPFIRFSYTRSHRVKLRTDIVRDIFLINTSYTLFTFSFDQYQPTPHPLPHTPIESVLPGPVTFSTLVTYSKDLPS